MIKARAGRRRPARRASASCAELRPVRLAQASRLRGDPGHPLDQAPDRRPSAAAATIAVAGHNVKLGRGGIREIEFFAQTQQLIWGGRDPGAARSRAPAPRSTRWPTPAASRRATADELIAAYRFLRRVEHRLQMVDDQQTQTPARRRRPSSTRIAAFLGYRRSRPRSPPTLLRHLGSVEGHYAELFEEAPTPRRRRGNLVFTGTDDDPETLATLGRAGLRRPRRGRRRSSAAGITAATAPRAARARASC